MREQRALHELTDTRHYAFSDPRRHAIEVPPAQGEEDTAHDEADEKQMGRPSQGQQKPGTTSVTCPGQHPQPTIGAYRQDQPVVPRDIGSGRRSIA